MRCVRVTVPTPLNCLSNRLPYEDYNRIRLNINCFRLSIIVFWSIRSDSVHEIARHASSLSAKSIRLEHPKIVNCFSTFKIRCAVNSTMNLSICDILHGLMREVEQERAAQSLTCDKIQHDSVFAFFAIELRMTLTFHLYNGSVSNGKIKSKANR